MPLVRTMATYACLWTFADLTEQKLISKKEVIDEKKTMRMVTTGTFVVAPCVCTWMRAAEWLFPGKKMTTVFQKVICDQLCFAPPMVSTFLAATNFLEGRGDFIAEWKQKFPKIYKTGLCFWPVVQTINFTFVKPEYRASVVGVASFAWSMFLCYIKEDNHKD